MKFISVSSFAELIEVFEVESWFLGLGISVRKEPMLDSAPGVLSLKF